MATDCPHRCRRGFCCFCFCCAFTTPWRLGVVLVCVCVFGVCVCFMCVFWSVGVCVECVVFLSNTPRSSNN